MADGSVPSQASSTAARCAVRTATPHVLAGDPLLLPDNEQRAPGPKACAHVGGRCVPPLSSTRNIGRAEAGKRDQMVLRGKRHPDPSTTFGPPASALGVSLSFASWASRVPPSAAALLAGGSGWQHTPASPVPWSAISREPRCWLCSLYHIGADPGLWRKHHATAAAMRR